jgi:hypothetical protein
LNFFVVVVILAELAWLEGHEYLQLNPDLYPKPKPGPTAKPLKPKPVPVYP